MTQDRQPDPFSELRGLIESLKLVADWLEDRSTTPSKHRASLVREASRSISALLDERDRLIEALTEMRTAGVYLCGCRARGAPKAFIPIAEQKFLDALDLARQALSQEIG